MKITGIRSGIVNMPSQELRGIWPDQKNPVWPTVWLELQTDEGIEGIGVSFFGDALTGTLKRAIDDLGALLIGDDPMRVEAVARKLFAAANGATSGIHTLAVSALDMALWDIKGKALGQPLWKLLGGARDRVPAYASGKLMRGLPLDEVLKVAASLKEQGWREVKTQLALYGDTSPAKELDRLSRIREVIGPEIKLLCDINQRWRPEQAIYMGRMIEDAGIDLGWLEDVTVQDDYPGLARVTAALSTPIAGGEYVWGIVPFRHMIEARAMDIAMIDLVRVGGITQWMKVAGMAEAFDMPVVSHLVPEIQVHLIAAAPNGLVVEHIAWMSEMYETVPQPVKGEIVAPCAPGLGLSFDKKALERYRA